MSPWDGASNYQYPPGTEGIPDTTIESDKYNAFIADLRDEDLNKARPIHRGGTGGTTAAAARTNLKAETACTDQIVSNYDAQVWQNGSFISSAGATGSPDGAGGATDWYVGTAWTDGNVIVLEARNGVTGAKYTRSKIGAGAWTAWGIVSAGQFVLKSGDTMTGLLAINPATGGAYVNLNPTQASQQAIFGFLQSGVAKWQLGKQTDDTFILFDVSSASGVFSVAPGAGGAFTFVRPTTFNGACHWTFNGMAGTFFSTQTVVDRFFIGTEPTGDTFRIFSAAASNMMVFDGSTGLATVKGNPTAALGIATKQYADLKLALTGGTISGSLAVTGALTVGGSPVWHTANFNPANYVGKGGDVMTGQLTIHNGAGSPNGTLYLGNNGGQIFLHYDSIRYILGGGAYNNRTTKLLIGSGLFDSIDPGGVGISIRAHDDATGPQWQSYSNNGTHTSTIRALGQFESWSNSYGAISDRRLKTSIEPATPKLEEVLRVPIINFEFNNDLREATGKQIGVADDDVAAIFPTLVYQTPIVNAKEVKQIETKSGIETQVIDLPESGGHNIVKTSVLFGPILMKAFQEFVAETRARLDQLES